jgi:hypothetical protein
MVRSSTSEECQQTSYTVLQEKYKAKPNRCKYLKSTHLKDKYSTFSMSVIVNAPGG